MLFHFVKLKKLNLYKKYEFILNPCDVNIKDEHE